MELIPLPPTSDGPQGRTWTLTSESVSEGHPDKLADRISDEILDACLAQNPRARVGVETLVTKGRCILAGEVGGVRGLDFEALARRAIRDVGYVGGDFDAGTVPVEVLIHGQSDEIAAAVDGQDGAEGAGDQGLMFGYACRETPELMPAPLVLAHRIVQRLAALRKAGESRLGPDAKSQVTMSYRGGALVCATDIVVSQQHAPGFGDALPGLVRPGPDVQHGLLHAAHGLGVALAQAFHLADQLGLEAFSLRALLLARHEHQGRATGNDPGDQRQGGPQEVRRVHERFLPWRTPSPPADAGMP